MPPKPGDKGPDFTLLDQDGNPVSLADFAGRQVVLYFYPKDDTSGCTKEACQFNEPRRQLPRVGDGPPRPLHRMRQAALEPQGRTAVDGFEGRRSWVLLQVSFQGGQAV
jgi:hypothetical protein